MTSEITPSKQVSDVVSTLIATALALTDRELQAASAMESFKMESPVKKLDFAAADKENKPLDDAAIAQMDEQPAATETKVVVKAEETSTVAPGIKPEEADEPLLRENPGRFVMFPIKYHEVSDASRRVKCSRDATSLLTRHV